MILPEKNDTYKHLFAYLIKARNIDKDIVAEFVDKKMIYEDRNKNCVFVVLIISMNQHIQVEDLQEQ